MQQLVRCASSIDFSQGNSTGKSAVRGIPQATNFVPALSLALAEFAALTQVAMLLVANP